MQTVKLIEYMEELRYKRKLSQHFYLEGIVSQRQYYRYRDGTSEPSFSTLGMLSDKLGIPLGKLITDYFENEEIIKKKTRKYFNHIINKNFNDANLVYLDLKDRNITDLDCLMTIKVGEVLKEFYLGTIHLEHFIFEVKKIINFESIMEKESLFDVELYMLGLIMEYSTLDRENVLEFILNAFKEDKILKTGNRLFVIQAYFWIIKNLGRLERYDDLINVAEEAIEYSKLKFSSYCLEYLYYYKALAHFNLQQKFEFDTEISNTLIVLLQLEESKKHKFLKTIENDTSINIEKYMKKIIDYKIQK